MDSELLGALMKIGVGIRSPKDPFFSEGNSTCQFLKSYSVFEVDKEEFLHPPANEFSCAVPSCDCIFSTVVEYDIHYNTCHRFTCAECKKKLPSPHLLDLHVSETHDSFFSVLSERKPMYKCYIESCTEVFKNGEERRKHCISFHMFPGDFRFDDFRKKKPVKKKSAEVQKSNTALNVVSNSASSQSMETDQQTKKSKRKKKKINSTTGSTDVMETDQNLTEVPKGVGRSKQQAGNICFGRGRGRGHAFVTFTKDMLGSLPGMDVDTQKELPNT